MVGRPMTRATLGRMNLHRTRFAVVLLGDRLCAAVIQGHHLDSFVVESEQPAAALRAELDARKVAPRTVAIGLPRSAVTVKPVELPAIGADTRDMIQFELERHLPFPTEDAGFDFVPLGETEPEAPADAARRVLIAAADRRVIDTALRLVQEARLRPRSITVAAHDLIALARIPSKARLVWIHRVDEAIDLLFIAGGGVVLSRTLPAADEAALALEIRRSFTLVKWRGPDGIWVSGDMAPPLGISDSPLMDLGAPVSAPAYTPLAREALESLEGGSRGARELATAVALSPSSPPLDLLPAALRPFRFTRAQLVTAGVAVVTVAAILAAFVAPGYRDGRRLKATNAEIARLDDQVRAVESMLKDLEGKRALLATVETLQDSALRPLPVLRELTELLPNDAWLTLLSIEPKGVELTGQANAASALIPLLENSPRFERAEFASPVTRGRDREQFRIQAAWETRGGAATTPPGGAARAGANAPATVPSIPPAAVAAPPAMPAVPPATPATPGAPAPTAVTRPGAAAPEGRR
jgi:Tfp pilus assembly protein PilN